jgi:hypothetical protein
MPKLDSFSSAYWPFTKRFLVPNIRTPPLRKTISPHCYATDTYTKAAPLYQRTLATPDKALLGVGPTVSEQNNAGIPTG